MGSSALHEAPEATRVIEFGEMAEFVDDDVVRNLGGKEDELVIEVEVPFFRTAPPVRFMVLDENFPHPKAVHGVEMLYACADEGACVFAHA